MHKLAFPVTLSVYRRADQTRVRPFNQPSWHPGRRLLGCHDGISWIVKGTGFAAHFPL